MPDEKPVWSIWHRLVWFHTNILWNIFDYDIGLLLIHHYVVQYWIISVAEINPGKQDANTVTRPADEPSKHIVWRIWHIAQPSLGGENIGFHLFKRMQFKHFTCWLLELLWSSANNDWSNSDCLTHNTALVIKGGRHICWHGAVEHLELTGPGA